MRAGRAEHAGRGRMESTVKFNLGCLFNVFLVLFLFFFWRFCFEYIRSCYNFPYTSWPHLKRRLNPYGCISAYKGWIVFCSADVCFTEDKLEKNNMDLCYLLSFSLSFFFSFFPKATLLTTQQKSKPIWLRLLLFGLLYLYNACPCTMPYLDQTTKNKQTNILFRFTCPFFSPPPFFCKLAFITSAKCWSVMCSRDPSDWVKVNGMANARLCV